MQDYRNHFYGEYDGIGSEEWYAAQRYDKMEREKNLQKPKIKEKKRKKKKKTAKLFDRIHYISD